eukprot:TRINITY_DN1591_c0_g1_i1.p1 TRINITY_DN1591_c0_g1~~TRINITY_DN1591_c0_g1_i1.p1  ORF type:complete len:899 (+),score=283.69 TRINITY_DN1591_c0_g1_i1:85-2697(+)
MPGQGDDVLESSVRAFYQEKNPERARNAKQVVASLRAKGLSDDQIIPALQQKYAANEANRERLAALPRKTSMSQLSLSVRSDASIVVPPAAAAAAAATEPPVPVGLGPRQTTVAADLGRLPASVNVPASPSIRQSSLLGHTPPTALAGLPPAASPPPPHGQGGDGPDAKAAAQVPFKVSDELIDSLVLGHLKTMGLQQTATVFAREAGTDPSPLDEHPDDDPQAHHVSALQLLFARKRTTADCIVRLLGDTRERLRASAHHYFDRDTMSLLDAMAREPMWSAPRRVYTKASGEQRGGVNAPEMDARLDMARMGILHAATLNQLVERITKIVIRPHVAQKKEERAADEQFCLSFLRTYKLFCSPQVLLAKLMQRFFVPLGLPLTDRYSNHYIFIGSQGTRSSCKWWDSVSAKLKCRVASTLLGWVNQFPDDWDQAMIESLATFIDDNFYEPTLDKPLVPTQLLQYAESIKHCLAKILARREDPDPPDDDDLPLGATDTAEQGLSLLSDSLSEVTLALQLTAADLKALRLIKVRELIDFTKNEMHFLFLDGLGEERSFGSMPAVVGAWDDSRGSLLSARSPPSPGMVQHSQQPSSPVRERTSTHWQSPPRGSPLPSPTGLGYSRHFPGPAERAPSPPVARSVRQRPRRAPQRARGLAAFLRRGADIERWAAVELLTTADERDRRLKCEKLVGLAFRLLELNNFQSCRAVVSGLLHPAVVRMKRFTAGVAHWDALQQLAEAVLESAPFAPSYKRMMQGLTDGERREHPPVPWLGCWVSELHLIEETEPTVLVDSGIGFIHWRKFQVISDIYKRFSALQELQVPPNYAVDSAVQQFLQRCLERSRSFDWPTLLQLSMLREPVGGGLKALPPEEP